MACSGMRVTPWYNADKLNSRIAQCSKAAKRAGPTWDDEQGPLNSKVADHWYMDGIL